MRLNILQRLGPAGASAGMRTLTFPLTAIATFASTSLMIGYAGPTAYAGLVIVATLTQLVPYADLGIGAGVVNAISAVEKGDPARLRATASAVRLLLLSTFALLLLGALGTTLFSWSSALHLVNTNLDGLDTATFLVIALIAITVPLGLGQRILVALMMSPAAIAISAVGPVLAFLCTLTIVLLELPIVLLVFPAVLGSLLVAIVCTLIAVRSLRFRWSMIWRRTEYSMTGLLSQGLWYLVLSVTSAFSFQWGRILLAARGTLIDVASYSLTMQFYLPLWSFFVVAGASLWPVFAKGRAQNVDQTLFLKRMILYFAVAAVAALAGLALLGPWFASALSHGTVDTGVALFVSCGALIFVQSAQLVLGVSLTSPRDLRFQALWGLPMSVFVVAGIWFLIPELGSISPFVAAAAGVLLFQVLPNVFRVWANERRRIRDGLSPTSIIG